MMVSFVTFQRLLNSKQHHLRFFAAKGHRVNFFPLKSAYMSQAVHQRFGNQAVPPVVFTLITNSRGGVQHIAIKNNFTLYTADLCRYYFSAMQPCFELRLHSKIFLKMIGFSYQ